MHIAEIEIVGSLMDRPLAPGTHIGNGRAVVDRVVVAGDVIRQIDAAQANGSRALLLVVESEGGDARSGLDVYRALRRFSEVGGRTIAYVGGRCASTGPLVVESCDYVLVSADALFLLHSAHAPEGVDVAPVNAVYARLLSERTGMPVAKLEALTADPEITANLHAAAAKRRGFADWEVSGLDHAREIAAIIAAGEIGRLPPSWRRDRPRVDGAQTEGQPEDMTREALLAVTAAASVACHNVSSSDGPITAVETYDPVRGLHETAARNWSARTNPGGSYRAIARSGTTFCAVGTGNACATSPDAVAWTSRTITTGNFQGIVWDGSQFVAVGYADVAATSPDGITWTARTIPTGSYYGVAWSGSILCAVASSGACATSPDGITWTARTIPAGSYYAVTWTGSQFVAVGWNVAATSPDGITWTARTIPAGNYRAVAWNGVNLCAIGSVCATSFDGITWTARTLPTIPGTQTYYALTWTGRVFCALGTVPITYAGVAITSPDGTAWDTQVTGLPHNAYDAMLWDGHMFVAVGPSATDTSLAVP